MQELFVQKHRDLVTTVQFVESKTLLDVERKSILTVIRDKENEIFELRRAIHDAQKKEQEIAAYGNLDTLSLALVESLIERIYLYDGMKMNIVWKNS